MFKSVRSKMKYGAIALGVMSSNAVAVQVDFHREISGKYFRGGALIGSYSADITYNVNPIDVRRHPVPGGEIDFPDFVAGYSPWPLYQDKFFISMTYFLGPDAPDGFQNRTISDPIPFMITDFIVYNDFEFQFSRPQDQFEIRASKVVDGTTAGLHFKFRTEAGSLSSTSLEDILLGNAEGIFGIGDPFATSSFSGAPIGFPGGPLTIGSVDEVGPIAPVPEPGTVMLFSLGMGSLLLMGFRGKRRKPAVSA